MGALWFSKLYSSSSHSYATPNRHMPYLPREILLQILEQLSIRTLWKDVRPSSLTLASDVDRIIKKRYLPSLKLISNLQKKCTPHHFHLSRLSRDESKAIFEAEPCDAYGFQNRFRPGKCRDCHVECIKVWEWRAQYELGQVGSKWAVKAMKGNLRFELEIHDPAEPFLGVFSMVVKVNAAKLGVRWDPWMGELSLDWRGLLDEYCANLYKKERMEKARERWEGRSWWINVFFAVLVLVLGLTYVVLVILVSLRLVEKGRKSGAI